MTRRHAYIAIAVVLIAFFLFGGGAAVVRVVAKLSRDPNDLLPQVRDALAELRRRLKAKGIDTMVGSTKRTPAQQEGVIADGASATTRSWHLLGRAVDLYPFGPDGKADLAGKYTDRFRTMHAEAKALGFRGLAFNADGSKRFITTSKGQTWDGGHLEFPEGMTYAQAETQAKKTGVLT